MTQTANPSVMNNPVVQGTSQSRSNTNSFFKRNLVRMIVIVLVLAVIGELIYGGLTLFAPSQVRNLNPLGPQVQAFQNSNLSLVTDKASYKKGDKVSLDVKLFTGGSTALGTDLVVKYDPAFLKPTDTLMVEPGQIYSQYTPVQVDREQGLIGFSGLPSQGSSGFSGVGSFAKLNFEALKDGQTQVTIVYTPGDTADSNVVVSEDSKDNLGSVGNADIMISETESTPVSSGQACESFTQECKNQNGVMGTQTCMGGVMKTGSCTYDPRNTVSCGVCK